MVAKATVVQCIITVNHLGTCGRGQLILSHWQVELEVATYDGVLV